MIVWLHRSLALDTIKETEWKCERERENVESAERVGEIQRNGKCKKMNFLLNCSE